MTAKEYLKRYEEARRQERRLHAEYEKEMELIDSVRSTLGGDGMPHGSGISKRVEDMAIKLTDKLLEWKMAELDAIRIRQEVFDFVRHIPGEKGDVLYERHIELLTWEKIARKMNYSERGVRYVYDRALALAEKRLKDSFPCIASH